MKKYIINSINYNHYKYLITVLDYETNTRSILKELQLEDKCSNCKILVDLVLKTGMGKYRFVQYPILENGMIDNTQAEYVRAEDLRDIEEKVNSILMTEREIVENSTLLSSQKKKLMS